MLTFVDLSRVFNVLMLFLFSAFQFYGIVYDLTYVHAAELMYSIMISSKTPLIECDYTESDELMVFS